MRIKWGLYYVVKYYDKDHKLANHHKEPLVTGYASEPVSPGHTKQIDKAFEAFLKHSLSSEWRKKVEFHVMIKNSRE